MGYDGKGQYPIKEIKDMNHLILIFKRIYSWKTRQTQKRNFSDNYKI